MRRPAICERRSVRELNIPWTTMASARRVTVERKIEAIRKTPSRTNKKQTAAMIAAWRALVISWPLAKYHVPRLPAAIAIPPRK